MLRRVRLRLGTPARAHASPGRGSRPCAEHDAVGVRAPCSRAALTLCSLQKSAAERPVCRLVASGCFSLNTRLLTQDSSSTM